MTARPSNPAMMRSVVDMRQTVRHRTNGRNLNGHGSLDVRLSDRWACQPTTARARRERSLEDVLATMEEARAMGRTALLEHYVNLFDAVLAGLPGLPRVDAIYQACRADVAEDVAEVEYRRTPCKQTARRWLDAMGREGRADTVAMAALREEWSL